MKFTIWGSPVHVETHTVSQQFCSNSWLFEGCGCWVWPGSGLPQLKGLGWKGDVWPKDQGIKLGYLWNCSWNPIIMVFSRKMAGYLKGNGSYWSQTLFLRKTMIVGGSVLGRFLLVLSFSWCLRHPLSTRTNDSTFLKGFHPPKQGLNSKQNKRHEKVLGNYYYK